ncbi:NF045616 family extracytoplasmic (lipo)protein [Acinetobacter sp. UBA6720]|uniref:NF045616 family extracytoplasmic (lipo)protein n=1 Tax=Acinetobacter sp. UBA6720 TaxID=1945953 RepID=UPI0032E511A6
MIMKKIIYSFVAMVLIGCNQQSRDLNTKIIDNNLCIFTNESRDYGNDSFLVETGKIDYSKEYQSEYMKSYKDTKFPINEKICVLIPLTKIEKNVAYTITLSTINKKFSSQICILENNSGISIKQVEAGKSTCE